MLTTKQDPHQNSDRQLVDAVTRGEQPAISDLYNRYAPAVLGLALRITRDHTDAEAVVVETFAQMWREAHRFQSQFGSVRRWVAGIARSRALEMVRARGGSRDLGDAKAVESAVSLSRTGQRTPSPPTNLLADQHARRTRGALASLAPHQRVALELAYFEGLTPSEIAERLDEPLETIKTRLRLGLRNLRTTLATEEYLDDGHNQFASSGLSASAPGS